MSSKTKTLENFFKNIEAGNTILSTFTDPSPLRIRWALLLAQMQSGKTFTYAFVAAEMLRLKIVDKVVVFCGNAETALRDQTRNCYDTDFKKLYRSYLRMNGIDETVIDELVAPDVIFGTALKKRPAQYTRTLFIWDESHFAQNKEMMVDRYLERIGIIPNGDYRPLKEKDIYVLSVSATPFSEVSDTFHETQGKLIVRFLPNEHYIGVRMMTTAGMIVPYKNVSTCLREQIVRTCEVFSGTKYGIVRIPCDKKDHGKADKNVNNIKQKIIEIAQSLGWNILHYYTTDEDAELESLDVLETAPEKNTLILVKNLCRMGQQLKKEHISFVMETSASSSSDVVLQGLLGRMCGYDSNLQIRICLNEKCYDGGSELTRYIQMFEGEMIENIPELMPTRAKNLQDGKMKINHSRPIIPIRLSRKNRNVNGSLGLELSGRPKNDDIPQYTLEVIAALKDEDEHQRAEKRINHNSPEDFEKIKRDITKIIDRVNPPPSKSWAFHCLNESFAKNISKSYKEKRPINGSSFGNCECIGENDENEKNKVVVWYATKSFPKIEINEEGCGIQEGDWFISTNIVFRDDELTEFKKLNEDEDKIKKTTKKELFCRRAGEGHKEQLIMSNGQLSVDISPDTATNVDKMCATILESIELSVKRSTSELIIHRKLTSNRERDEEYQGIYVTQEVFDALSKNGSIYQRVRAEGLKLKIKKQQVLDDPNYPRFIRLSEISW